MKYAAVIDIGKTNKKILVFDESLQLVDSVYKCFEEFVQDGIHYEDVQNMCAWIKRELSTFAKKYDIRAISVATHGATALCIDAQGNLAVPPVAYTTDAGEEFRQEFYATFGHRDELQRSTGTAEIGNMINIAKKLFFMQKKFPDQFKETAHILNYPQYIGYLFTGKIGAEPTYVGCHSYLYDFNKKHWSDVAKKLGVIDKLPTTISRSWDVLGTVSPEVSRETGLSTDCIVTLGIHDSNSSLLPYLVKGHDNFILNSTGTWCVAMHPTSSAEFAGNEIGKLVFFNMSAFGGPVKTSIFMGGLEYETYTSLFKGGSYESHMADQNLYQRIITDRKLYILPSVVKGTGIFPNAAPRVIENGVEYPLEDIKSGRSVPMFFSRFDEAMAVLNISLAIQTKAALEIAGFSGGTIFTEGGFRKNNPYTRLLSTLFPGSQHAVTSMKEATAFGAAILAKAALDGTSPTETANCFSIDMIPIEPMALSGMDEYCKDFMSRI